MQRPGGGNWLRRFEVHGQGGTEGAPRVEMSSETQAAVLQHLCPFKRQEVGGRTLGQELYPALSTNQYLNFVLTVTLWGRCHHLIYRCDGGGAISPRLLVSDRPVLGRSDLMAREAALGPFWETGSGLKGRAWTRPTCGYREVGQAGKRDTQEMGVSGQHETMCQGKGASLYKLQIKFGNGNATRMSCKLLKVQNNI